MLREEITSSEVHFTVYNTQFSLTCLHACLSAARSLAGPELTCGINSFTTSEMAALAIRFWGQPLSPSMSGCISDSLREWIFNYDLQSGTALTEGKSILPELRNLCQWNFSELQVLLGEMLLLKNQHLLCIFWCDLMNYKLCIKLLLLWELKMHFQGNIKKWWQFWLNENNIDRKSPTISICE